MLYKLKQNNNKKKNIENSLLDIPIGKVRISHFNSTSMQILQAFKTPSL